MEVKERKMGKNKRSLFGGLLVLALFLILSLSVFGANELAVSVPANQSMWNQTRSTIEFSVSGVEYGNITVYRGSSPTTTTTLVFNNASIRLNWTYLWDISGLADGTYWFNVTYYNASNGTAEVYTPGVVNSSNVTGFITMDSLVPTCAVSDPPTNQVIANGSWSITYTPTDSNEFGRCILFMSNHTSGGNEFTGFNTIEDDSSITRSAANSYSLSADRDESVWYYIDCYDNHANIGTCGIRANTISFGGAPPIRLGGGGGPISGGGVPGTAIGIDIQGIQEAVRNNVWIVALLVGVGVIVF